MLIGKDKSVNEQINILEQILKKSKNIMTILKILEEYSKENKNRLLEYVYELGGNENATY